MNRRSTDEEDYSSMRNGKITWWMMSLIAVVVGISLTAWLGWVYGLSETVYSNTQRITRVEECVVYVKESLGQLNNKMDKVLDKR